MDSEIKTLINVWLSIIASLCYSYFFSAKIPKGKYRLISLLPIISLFTILPLYLSSAFFISVTFFFITWLSSFKLLLFAFDMGPLSPKSLPLFITVASLPIMIKQNTNHPQSPPKVPLNLATKIVFFAIWTSVLYDHRARIPQKIVLVMYCLGIFLLIDILIASSSALVRALVGLELEPPSDEPYLSTSLRDFWGRRWNLTVTNILRATVYKPVRSYLTASLGGKWASLPAVMSTFIVSGLIHELLIYYVTHVTPSWEMTSFFVLHGFCVVVEFVLKRTGLTDRWRLPSFVSGPLTVGFVVVTGFWLFFPPLVRNGADVRVIEEFKTFVDFIFRNLKFLIFW